MKLQSLFVISLMIFITSCAFTNDEERRFENGFNQSIENAVESGFTVPSLIGVGVSGLGLAAYKGLKLIRQNRDKVKNKRKNNLYEANCEADQVVDLSTSFRKES